MDLKKIAIRVARAGKVRRASDELHMDARLPDGAGADVSYRVEFTGGAGADLDISNVVREDTNQDVDVESFKTIFGKKALEGLYEGAGKLSEEVEAARAEESMDGAPEDAGAEKETVLPPSDDLDLGDDEGFMDGGAQAQE